MDRGVRRWVVCMPDWLQEVALESGSSEQVFDMST